MSVPEISVYSNSSAAGRNTPVVLSIVPFTMLYTGNIGGHGIYAGDMVGVVIIEGDAVVEIEVCGDGDIVAALIGDTVEQDDIVITQMEIDRTEIFQFGRREDRVGLAEAVDPSCLAFAEAVLAVREIPVDLAVLIGYAAAALRGLFDGVPCGLEACSVIGL